MSAQRESDGGANGAPAHLGPTWRYVALRRATETEGRRPLLCLPESLPVGTPREKYAVHATFWEGHRLAWAELRDVVDGQGFDVGVLPDVSGLVILDCDVKEYAPETGFVRVPGMRNGVQLAPPVVKHGIDDLARVAAELGHDPAELDTYAVATKSGGRHLYFSVNPRFPLSTSGHRRDWRVDVIARNGAANRSWAAAPPTEGYEVVRDAPVAVLPDWLGVWLTNLRANTEPLGGARRRWLGVEATRAHGQLQGRSGALPDADGDSLPARYVQLLLGRVALANQVGGWNNAIYDVAHLVLELGVELPEATAMIIEAAAPVSDAEERAAVRTIRSAHDKQRRQAIREGRAR